MAYFNWTDDLSVNNSTIDSQHLKLIEMINDFYGNIKNHSNEKLINTLLIGMRKYAQLHFNHEEMYMKQNHYPEYETHKKEHDLFIEKLVELEKKHSQGKILLTFEITSYLKDWVKRHIKVVDKRYSQFFNEKGIG